MQYAVAVIFKTNMMIKIYRNHGNFKPDFSVTKDTHTSIFENNST